MTAKNGFDITVVGAGLAGCEAAWQAARLGATVRLIDMKPAKLSPAHHSADFSELVCSNSLGAQAVDSAKGLLKQELRELGSLVVRCADAHRVPAGGALAVDREGFAAAVTRELRENAAISVECAEVMAIPDGRPCVIATGPLTADGLSAAIRELLGADSLYFFDAAAPIISIRTVDETRTFRASRYGKGDMDDTPKGCRGVTPYTSHGDADAYVNCPFTREEYLAFVDALLGAETAEPHGFEESRLFEGCMPVESMARRGVDTLRFGPLKPVGLTDPATGREPYAAAQLRRDDDAGELYNLVGFQTRLKFPEQRRVFRMIPGLERAEFMRYGVMHRNTYIDSPRALDAGYALRDAPGIFFAGQLTGVEGYVESVSSGLTAGINAVRALRGMPAFRFPPETLTGALAAYISSDRRGGGAGFQPMNANFGILPPLAAQAQPVASSAQIPTQTPVQAQPEVPLTPIPAQTPLPERLQPRRRGRGGRPSRRERAALYAERSLAAMKSISRNLFT